MSNKKVQQAIPQLPFSGRKSRARKCSEAKAEGSSGKETLPIPSNVTGNAAAHRDLYLAPGDNYQSLSLYCRLGYLWFMPIIQTRKHHPYKAGIKSCTGQDP